MVFISQNGNLRTVTELIGVHSYFLKLEVRIGCQTLIAPPSPEKTMHVRKKMKTSTGSPFNSISLLKSPVVSVPSNGATNNLKKEGRKKKKRLKSS